MGVKNPCHGCKDRQLGCHIVCRSYKDFRAERDKANEERHKRNQLIKGSMHET